MRSAPLATRPPRVVSIDTGDHRARVLHRRDALAAAHCAGSADDLVTPIAAGIARHLPMAFEIDDLVGAGNFGLLRAATRYRPRQHGGTPFSAFARPRIRGAIHDSIRRKQWEENTRPSLDPTLPMPEPLDEHAEACIVATIDQHILAKRLAAAVGRLSARRQKVIRGFYAETRETAPTLAARAAAITELRRLVRQVPAA